MTETLNIKNKSIVVPGEQLATGMGHLPGRGTYRKDNNIYAEQLGIASVDGKVIKIIPVSGAYVPRANDKVIARITNITANGWLLNINSAYNAFLSVKEATHDFVPRGADLTQYFKIGDLVFAKISSVTTQKLIDCSMKGPGLRILKGGRTITVGCQKVPRIIGKEGSMVNLIKNETGAHLFVGQNGVIWVNGAPDEEVRVVQALRYIEANAHKKGVTDKVEKLLNTKNTTEGKQ